MHMYGESKMDGWYTVGLLLTRLTSFSRHAVLAGCCVFLSAACYGMEFGMTSAVSPDVSKELARLSAGYQSPEALVSQGKLLYPNLPWTCAAICPDQYWEDRLASLVEQFGRTAVVASTDIQGQTPMHLAAARKGMGPLALLLLSYNADPNSRDACGRVPLHLAVGYGCCSSIRLLLGRGALINATDKEGSGVLHYAACSARPEVVALLAARGAKSCPNYAGKLPVDFWHQMAQEMVLDVHHELRQRMERAFTDADNHFAPFLLEEAERRRGIVEQRSRELQGVYGCARRLMLSMLELDNRTYIAACERYAHGRHLDQLSKACLCTTFLQEEQERQALLVTQQAQHVELVNSGHESYQDAQLREQNRHVLERTISNLFAHDQRVRRRIYDTFNRVIKRMISNFFRIGGEIIRSQLRNTVAKERGARVELEYACHLERTCLGDAERLLRRQSVDRLGIVYHEAQERNRIKCAWLDSQTPAVQSVLPVVFGSQVPGWWTRVQVPLIYAARHNDVVAARRALVMGGVPRRCNREDGMAPVHHAAASNAVDVLRLLLQADPASRLVKDECNHDTPLQIAVRAGHEAAVEALLDHGGDEYVQREVFYSLKHFNRNHESAIGIALRGSPIWERLNVKFEEHDMLCSPLHSNILAQRWEGLSALKPQDGCLGLRTSRCLLTPLQAACCQGSVDVVRTVLRQFGGIMECDALQRTALHTAAYQNKVDAVRELLAVNVNHAAKDSMGKTALDLAPHGSEVARLLETTQRFYDQYGRPSGAVKMRIDNLIGWMKLRYPIIYAAAYGPIEIIRDFVCTGVSRDVLRATLHVARGFERDDAIIAFLEASIPSEPGGRCIKK